MSNRNRNFTGNVVDAEVRDGQATPVEGEKPLPPAEAAKPPGGIIGRALTHQFCAWDFIKVAAIAAAGVGAYSYGKKKGRKQAEADYRDSYQNEYEADYRQVDSDESE